MLFRPSYEGAHFETWLVDDDAISNLDELGPDLYYCAF